MPIWGGGGWSEKGGEGLIIKKQCRIALSYRFSYRFSEFNHCVHMIWGRNPYYDMWEFKRKCLFQLIKWKKILKMADTYILWSNWPQKLFSWVKKHRKSGVAITIWVSLLGHDAVCAGPEYTGRKPCKCSNKDLAPPFVTHLGKKKVISCLDTQNGMQKNCCRRI